MEHKHDNSFISFTFCHEIIDPSCFVGTLSSRKDAADLGEVRKFLVYMFSNRVITMGSLHKDMRTVQYILRNWIKHFLNTV